MHPSYAGHCVSFETVPTIILWTVFQVFVLHIPSGNVFALELVILSHSTPTQTLPYCWGGTAILPLSAVYVSAAPLLARQSVNTKNFQQFF
jgi:hypothetical protein